MVNNIRYAVTVVAVALAAWTNCWAEETIWTKTVELDLKSPVYSVNVVPQGSRPDELLCDLAVKGNDVVLVDKRNGEVLIKNGQLIKSGIKPGDRFDFEFHHGATDVKVGVHVEFVKRSKSVSLQLRPTITEKGFIKQRRYLERLLAAAQTVNENLPGMQQNLGVLLWEYNMAVAVARGAQAFERTQAARDVFILNQKIGKLRQQIAKAQQLVANQPAVAKELDVLLAVGDCPGRSTKPDFMSGVFAAHLRPRIQP